MSAFVLHKSRVNIGILTSQTSISFTQFYKYWKTGYCVTNHWKQNTLFSCTL